MIINNFCTNEYFIVGFYPGQKKQITKKTATQILAIQGKHKKKVMQLYSINFNSRNGDSLSVMDEECCIVHSKRVLRATEI